MKIENVVLRLQFCKCPTKHAESHNHSSGCSAEYIDNTKLVIITSSVVDACGLYGMKGLSLFYICNKLTCKENTCLLFVCVSA